MVTAKIFWLALIVLIIACIVGCIIFKFVIQKRRKEAWSTLDIPRGKAVLPEGAFSLLSSVVAA